MDNSACRRAQYKFVLTTQANLVPSRMLVQTKILDGTPGVIEKYVTVQRVHIFLLWIHF